VVSHRERGVLPRRVRKFRGGQRKDEADVLGRPIRATLSGRGIRRAVVANSEAAFGMARMYAIASENTGQTIEVFRDMDAAESCLNLDR
jgi:hypothetical protein